MAENFQQPRHKIEAIEEIAPRHPTDKVNETREALHVEQVKFDAALERADPARANFEIRQLSAEESVQGTQKPSPIDVVKESKSVAAVVPTKDALISDAVQLKQKFQAPQAYLLSYQEKNIEIPKEFAKEMDTRVQRMDKSLGDTDKILGGVPVESVTNTQASPTSRFLHFLTDADKRLENIVGDINIATGGGKKLSTEKLLAVQVKLNYVQQELEFFTNILNRSVEAIKTLMNVQI